MAQIPPGEKQIIVKASTDKKTLQIYSQRPIKVLGDLDILVKCNLQEGKQHIY